eukprot:jgi/Mesen1/6556/ME000334S05894
MGCSLQPSCSLARDPYGVYALVVTPTRELAIQIAEQFRALGSGLHLRDAVVIGGMDMTAQALALAGRPHVVVATPGRLLDHLDSDPGVAAAFAHTKFLVLDEADRLLDAGFERELRGLLARLPPASSIGGGQEGALLERRELFHWEAYAGLQTVESLRQEYLFIPAKVKEVYLHHIMAALEDEGARSAIVFTSTCRSCHLLCQLLEELGVASTSLHSLKSQQRRLAALARFRSGQVPILIATDVAARGLDIPSVDLVINYDIPRFARDYVHRVGRTARAGRGGRAVSFVTQYDVELVHGIEALVGAKLQELPLDEDDVFKAKRAALLKMSETGFDDLVKTRKESKMRGRAEAGPLPKAMTEKKKRRPEI